MAKGNMLLGMSRGSVGDVTFYRRNGNQIARARNRVVKNNNTEKQLIQRAIMATVVRAYAAGSTILDHSFQGKSVGAENMQAFLKKNMKALRAAVAADINGSLAAASCAGRVVSRGAVVPTPWSYIVSEGELIQSLYQVAMVDDELTVKLATAPGENVTLGDYLQANNINAGDIFTIISYSQSDATDASDVVSPTDTQFNFLRLTVLDSAVESTLLASQAKIYEAFKVEGAISSDAATQAFSAGITIASLTNEAHLAGALGVIRSRDDSGKRSNCTLVCTDGMPWGIASANLLDAWNPESSSVGQSSLILEGGNF